MILPYGFVTIFALAKAVMAISKCEQPTSFRQSSSPPWHVEGWWCGRVLCLCLTGPIGAVLEVWSQERQLHITWILVRRANPSPTIDPETLGVWLSILYCKKSPED